MDTKTKDALIDAALTLIVVFALGVIIAIIHG